MFDSAVASYGGALLGVVLTGMGADGAEELKQLRDLGAATFAQNRETSVVWGMPGEAVRRNAAEFVDSPPVLASLLTEISGAADSPRS